MSELEVLSTDDLRSRLFETLKKRGYVDVLKVSRSGACPGLLFLLSWRFGRYADAVVSIVVL